MLTVEINNSKMDYETVGRRGMHGMIGVQDFIELSYWKHHLLKFTTFLKVDK